MTHQCDFSKCSSGKPCSFEVQDGVIKVSRNGYYLDSPEARERLLKVCEGHVYLAGLTPAIPHPATGKWVAGIIQRVGGRDENDHPFYSDLCIPLGMSPVEAAELQFPGCEVGGMSMDEEEARLSSSPITLRDLFPYGTEDILGTGIPQEVK